MKLYYIPGACSLAPHIVLHELGICHKLVRVSGADKRTDDGRDYKQIMPLGYVPALELDDGRILTEVTAIIQYLADIRPEKNLAPKYGTYERALMQQWLSFIGTEIRKNLAPLFSSQATEAEKRSFAAKLTARMKLTEEQLAKTPYIAGYSFTPADAYLYVILTWVEPKIFALDAYPLIEKYMEKISQRPSVIEAKKDEGLA